MKKTEEKEGRETLKKTYLISFHLIKLDEDGNPTARILWRGHRILDVVQAGEIMSRQEMENLILFFRKELAEKSENKLSEIGFQPFLITELA